MNRNRYLFAGMLLTAAAFAVTGALYPRLPAQMPIHWGLSGEADGYGAKQWAAFLLPGLTAGWLLLSRLLPWLSPKRFEVEPFWSTYEYVVFIIVAWMGYAQGAMLWGALAKVEVGKAMIAGVFLLFALLGNVLGKVRPNFWIGVRTPWTIANEQVWTETHRFAARLYFAVGLVSFVAVLAGAPTMWCFIGLIVGLFVPVVYSLVRYKQVVSGDRRSGRRPVLILLIVLASALLVGGTGWVLAYASPRAITPPPDLVRSANALVTDLEREQWEAAREGFTAQMRQGLPAGKLQQVWEALVRQNGEFRGRKGVRAERLAGYRAVYVTCQFDRSRVDLKVVFDTRGRIGGLWVVPSRPEGGQ